jgi:hypothetical protein
MGLSKDTLRHLKDCVENHGFNKVEVLLHMLQSCITDAHDHGILAVPPPILSRVYQTISRGYVNLLNTKKITDTKFPFPFVQVIAVLLLIHTILTPFMIATTVKSLVVAPVLTFVFVFGMFALNFISMELEDPFGEDDNDLPLAHFQAEMNNCLMMLLHHKNDMIAGVSSRCVMDFNKLKDAVSTTTTMHMRKSRSCTRLSVAEEDLREDVDQGSPDEEIAGTSDSIEAGCREGDTRASIDMAIVGSEMIMHSVLLGPSHESAPAGAAATPGFRPPALQSVPCFTTESGKSGDKLVHTGAERMHQQVPRSDASGQQALELPEPRLMHKNQMHQLLITHTADLKDSLHRWTEMLEKQVCDLTQRFRSLSELGDPVNPTCRLSPRGGLAERENALGEQHQQRHHGLGDAHALHRPDLSQAQRETDRL